MRSKSAEAIDVVLPLPIDPLLPEIVARVRETGRCVLEAPPGAGKTTRVPAALLDAGIAGAREIVVLEPRRLAARLSAKRVAEERGGRLGDEVGFQIRFEEVAGPRTRIRYVTEGVLARRLLADPRLERVGAVVLDEFHERHLAGDMALALLRRLREGSRPDLALVVMSATLDAAPVAAYLGGAPRVRSEGRAHAVSIEPLAQRDERPLETQVAAAVSRLVAEGLEGDVLVFLPGAAEIRRAGDACRALAAAHDLLVVPLHGDLPSEDQDRAIRPASKRKVILSTNVAETSVTIDGVVAVVDGGLARVAGHDPWSGLPRLSTEKISRASAAQRAGRAGRTRPGRCLRLYTRADHEARPAHDVPEVRRADLAEAVLELHASGVADPASFPWFEAPEPASLLAARTLLERLGAVDPAGRVSETGRHMLRLPLHPRLARLVVEAERRGVGDDGALAAALLSERDLRLSTRAPGLAGGRGRRSGPSGDTGPSDVLALLDAFDAAASSGFHPERCRAQGLDAQAARAAERVRAQVARIMARDAGPARAASPSPDPETALLLAVLAAYPDRVARRRRPGAPEIVLCEGGQATLGEESVVREAELVVAVDAVERPRGGPVVRVASAIEAEWLVELFPERLVEEVVARWDAVRERADVVRRTRYAELVLEESVRSEGGPEASRVLAAEALRAGPAAFVDAEALARLVARSAFAAEHAPAGAIEPVTEEALRAALAGACEGRASFRELREAGLLEQVLAGGTPAARRLLETLAPERVTLHAGSSPRVEYAAGRAPWLEAPMQDFFGLAAGPSVAGGRVPVTLHLLGPNRRPVQVTTDLAGFWDRHYPAVRRELSRRYPRHAWPEDPRSAVPPPRRAPRKRPG